MSIRIVLLLVVAGSGLGQAKQNPLDGISEPLSIPSDNVCGKVERTLTGQPAVDVQLELKPVSYKFQHPHGSSVEMRVGRTLKKSSSGQGGKFDLRDAAPGSYMVRIVSSPDGAWGRLNILPRSGHNSCPLKLALDAEKKTVTLSKD